jgi:amidase
LKIACWCTAWEGITVDAECVAAVKHTASLLRSLGHEVIETAPPPLDYAKFIDATVAVLASNVVVTVNGVVGSKPPSEWRQQLEPAFRDAYQLGKTVTAEQYIGAITTFHSIGRRIERHISGFDLALTPTLTRPPVHLNELHTNNDFHTFREAVSRYTAFLAVINASGQPAASLPLYWSADGLPIGVQLIGHFGREDQVLQLSAYLESEHPWASRRPSQM